MMPFPRRLLLACLCFALPAAATDGPYAKQLRAECDGLVSLAVRRPYGVAWAPAKPDPKPKGGAQGVVMDPPGSAGAAFVLYWSADLLDAPAYKEAAYQAVRGIGAAQKPTGQVPGRPVFQPNVAGGREEAALVADRGATRAALALALSVLDDTGGADELSKRIAQRSVGWLLKQQAALGGWPIGYPPSTAPKDAARLARLDTPDFRDSTLAMMLAADVMHDNLARAAAQRSMTALQRMRIGQRASRDGGALWAGFYTLDTYVTDRVAGYPPGVDLLGSRYAMQTCMGAYLLLEAPVANADEPAATPYDLMVRQAAVAVGKLPTYADGEWLRNYNYNVQATLPPPRPDVPMFNRPPTTQEASPAVQLGTWGMRSVLRTAEAMKGKSREEFAAVLAKHLPVRQRIEAALCGLDDQPFSVDWPGDAGGAERFLKEYPGTFGVLAEGTPEDVQERVRRAYVLFLRARIEIKYGK